MTKTLIKGALAGGIIAFAWGWVSWMLLPWHTQNLHKFKDEKLVADTLMANTGDVQGVYVLPSCCTGKQEKNALTTKDGTPTMTKDGIPVTTGDGTSSTAEDNKSNKIKTFAFVAYSPDRIDCQTKTLLVELLTQIIAAFFITCLLCKTKDLSYWHKVKFVTVVGLVGGLLCYIPAWNWWNFPVNYVLVGLADLFIAWFLAGLALAKIAVCK